MNYLTTRNRDIPSIFNDVFFRDFFAFDFFSPLPTLKKIDYPVDIHEDENGLVLDIAAIGLNKSDIKIDIKDNVLSVSHEKEEKKEDEKYAYRGITQKSFNLAWRINDKFDITQTQAELEKGLLKITVPLSPERKPKEIEVKIK